MAELIEPRTLKGFRDYPPDLMMLREALLDAARRVFRSFGFAPIDTPALEYAEILVGKMDAQAEIQRQLYRFRDHGDRDVAMRFDLTVPLARFVAQHGGQLTFPFKRYHIAPVWRGENTQAGRYREFFQCDFDTIGSGTLSNAADIETALVIDSLMLALGFERFEVRVNNRLVLNGLLEELGLARKSAVVLIALDKLAKHGRDKVISDLTMGVGLDPTAAHRVVGLAATRGGSDEVLALVERDFGRNAKAAEGVARLRELVACARMCGIPDTRLRVDLSICRGL